MGGSRFLLRFLAREQHQQTLALQEIARQLRIQNQQSGDLGFITGAPIPGGEDESGISYTSGRDIVELLQVEQELLRQKGMRPSEDAVVEEWEARKRN
jgi:hypothetical protein